MRICRFDDNRLGVATPDGIQDVTDVLSGLPSWTYPLPAFDPFIARLPDIRAKLQERARQTPARSLDGMRLLSPVADRLVLGRRAVVDQERELGRTEPSRRAGARLASARASLGSSRAARAALSACAALGCSAARAARRGARLVVVATACGRDAQ